MTKLGPQWAWHYNIYELNAKQHVKRYIMHSYKFFLFNW